MKKSIILILLIFAIGCTKTKYVKPTITPAESTDETIVEETMKTDVEEEVIEEVAIATEDKVDEEAISPEEKAKNIFKDVLFDYDKYSIRPEARPTLDAVSSFLNENMELNVIVEGHCDERGTNEYNLALGEKRAKSTKKYLVSLGVAPSRVIIVTYGEEKTLCSDRTESCWQSNRRAHFVVAK